MARWFWFGQAVSLDRVPCLIDLLCLICCPCLSVLDFRVFGLAVYVLFGVWWGKGWIGFFCLFCLERGDCL